MGDSLRWAFAPETRACLEHGCVCAPCVRLDRVDRAMVHRLQRRVPAGQQKILLPAVTDHASRYLLLCEALESTCESVAFTAFDRLFKERGLPGSMRSDNGVPFASPNSDVSYWAAEISTLAAKRALDVISAVRSQSTSAASTMPSSPFESSNFNPLLSSQNFVTL